MNRYLKNIVFLSLGIINFNLNAAEQRRPLIKQFQHPANQGVTYSFDLNRPLSRAGISAIEYYHNAHGPAIIVTALNSDTNDMVYATLNTFIPVHHLIPSYHEIIINSQGEYDLITRNNEFGRLISEKPGINLIQLGNDLVSGNPGACSFYRSFLPQDRAIHPLKAPQPQLPFMAQPHIQQQQQQPIMMPFQQTQRPMFFPQAPGIMQPPFTHAVNSLNMQQPPFHPTQSQQIPQQGGYFLPQQPMQAPLNPQPNMIAQIVQQQLTASKTQLEQEQKQKIKELEAKLKLEQEQKIKELEAKFKQEQEQRERKQEQREAEEKEKNNRQIRELQMKVELQYQELQNKNSLSIAPATQRSQTHTALALTQNNHQPKTLPDFIQTHDQQRQHRLLQLQQIQQQQQHFQKIRQQKQEQQQTTTQIQSQPQQPLVTAQLSTSTKDNKKKQNSNTEALLPTPLSQKALLKMQQQQQKQQQEYEQNQRQKNNTTNTPLAAAAATNTPSLAATSSAQSYNGHTHTQKNNRKKNTTSHTAAQQKNQHPTLTPQNLLTRDGRIISLGNNNSTQPATPITPITNTQEADKNAISLMTDSILTSQNGNKQKKVEQEASRQNLQKLLTKANIPAQTVNETSSANSISEKATSESPIAKSVTFSPDTKPETTQEQPSQPQKDKEERKKRKKERQQAAKELKGKDALAAQEKEMVKDLTKNIINRIITNLPEKQNTSSVATAAALNQQQETKTTVNAASTDIDTEYSNLYSENDRLIKAIADLSTKVTDLKNAQKLKNDSLRLLFLRQVESLLTQAYDSSNHNDAQFDQALVDLFNILETLSEFKNDSNAAYVRALKMYKSIYDFIFNDSDEITKCEFLMGGDESTAIEHFDWMKKSRKKTLFQDVEHVDGLITTLVRQNKTALLDTFKTAFENCDTKENATENLLAICKGCMVLPHLIRNCITESTFRKTAITQLEKLLKETQKRFFENNLWPTQPDPNFYDEEEDPQYLLNTMIKELQEDLQKMDTDSQSSSANTSAAAASSDSQNTSEKQPDAQKKKKKKNKKKESKPLTEDEKAFVAGVTQLGNDYDSNLNRFTGDAQLRLNMVQRIDALQQEFYALDTEDNLPPKLETAYFDFLVLLDRFDKPGDTTVYPYVRALKILYAMQDCLSEDTMQQACNYLVFKNENNGLEEELKLAEDHSTWIKEQDKKKKKASCHKDVLKVHERIKNYLNPNPENESNLSRLIYVIDNGFQEITTAEQFSNGTFSTIAHACKTLLYLMQNFIDAGVHKESYLEQLQSILQAHRKRLSEANLITGKHNNYDFVLFDLIEQSKTDVQKKAEAALLIQKAITKVQEQEASSISLSDLQPISEALANFGTFSGPEKVAQVQKALETIEQLKNKNANIMKGPLGGAIGDHYLSLITSDDVQQAPHLAQTLSRLVLDNNLQGKSIQKMIQIFSSRVESGDQLFDMLKEAATHVRYLQQAGFTLEHLKPVYLAIARNMSRYEADPLFIQEQHQQNNVPQNNNNFFAQPQQIQKATTVIFEDLPGVISLGNIGEETRAFLAKNYVPYQPQ